MVSYLYQEVKVLQKKKKDNFAGVHCMMSQFSSAHFVKYTAHILGWGRIRKARSKAHPLPVEMIIRRLINLDFVRRSAHLYL